MIGDLLHLKSQKASHYDELIGMDGLRWASANRRRASRPAERTLEARYAEMLPELRRRVGAFAGWGIGYTTTREIDDYFLECGRLYLNRMFGSDMLARRHYRRKAVFAVAGTTGRPVRSRPEAHSLRRSAEGSSSRDAHSQSADGPRTYRAVHQRCRRPDGKVPLCRDRNDAALADAERRESEGPYERERSDLGTAGPGQGPILSSSRSTGSTSIRTCSCSTI